MVKINIKYWIELGWPKFVWVFLEHCTNKNSANPIIVFSVGQGGKGEKCDLYHFLITIKYNRSFSLFQDSRISHFPSFCKIVNPLYEVLFFVFMRYSFQVEINPIFYCTHLVHFLILCLYFSFKSKKKQNICILYRSIQGSKRLQIQKRKTVFYPIQTSTCSF